MPINEKFEGTQGKWNTMVGGFKRNGNESNMIQIYATNDDLEMVCKVYKDQILHQRTQNHEANALLISKAPELLEKSVALVNHFECVAIPKEARQLLDELEGVVLKALDIN